MYTSAVNDYIGRSGVKVFILDFAELAAVDCVGIVRAEPLYIEHVRTASNLFIRCKSNTYFTVLYCWIVHERLNKRHYFRDAGFVVGAEKRRPVCNDYVLTDVALD